MMLYVKGQTMREKSDQKEKKAAMISIQFIDFWRRYPLT